jgi:pimeloyl-ACP methyl ester carboxylesterase
MATGLRRPASYVGVAREASASLLSFGMWPLGLLTPGAAPRWSDPVAPRPAAHRRRHEPVGGNRSPAPVVLVHGYGGNRTGLSVLARRLRAAGISDLHAFEYNPFAGDLHALANRLGGHLDDLRDQLGVERIQVVGHSLGGLLARYAVQVLGVSGVATCATVSSPHGGVELVRFLPPVLTPAPFTAGVQLRADSAFMTLLRSSARPLATRFVSCYSDLDVIVPARRAEIVEPELDATNVLVPGHGHHSLLLSAELGSVLTDHLRRSDPGRAPRSAAPATPATSGSAVPGPAVGLAATGPAT